MKITNNLIKKKIKKCGGGGGASLLLSSYGAHAMRTHRLLLQLRLQLLLLPYACERALGPSLPCASRAENLIGEFKNKTIYNYKSLINLALLL